MTIPVSMDRKDKNLKQTVSGFERGTESSALYITSSRLSGAG